MNDEYQMVRDVMKKQLRLSPCNEKEPLCLVVDGSSSVGAGYVLFQWRDSKDPGAGVELGHFFSAPVAVAAAMVVAAAVAEAVGSPFKF